MERLGLLRAERTEAQILDRPLGPMKPLQIYDERRKDYIPDPHQRRQIDIKGFIAALRPDELHWTAELREAKLVVVWVQDGDLVVARVLREFLGTPGFYAQRVWNNAGWIAPFYLADEYRLSARDLGELPPWAWPNNVGRWLGLSDDEWRRLAA